MYFKPCTISINELVHEMYKACNYGIIVNQGIDDLMLLLFADDVVLFSFCTVGLERQLDVLYEYYSKWGLSVNTDKSKIIVFRKRGILSKHEKWTYNNMNLETVTYYIVFSSRLIWTKTCETLAMQASKAMEPVLILLNNNGHIDFKTACKIFDSKIFPILTYGSEIWGVK